MVYDDKATYLFVPKMIKYYLDQDPILKYLNLFTTNHSDKDYILNNMHEQ